MEFFFFHYFFFFAIVCERSSTRIVARNTTLTGEQMKRNRWEKRRRKRTWIIALCTGSIKKSISHRRFIELVPKLSLSLSFSPLRALDLGDAKHLSRITPFKPRVWFQTIIFLFTATKRSQRERKKILTRF